MARFRFLIVVLACAVAVPALAQRPLEPPVIDQPRAEPRNRAPVPPPVPQTLDTLYEKLAKAREGQEARAIAAQIERRWLRSGSDTADLLMSRVVKLMAAKDHERAIDLLDYVITLRPEWAEAYHKRATVFFVMDDYDGALRDIRATLAREPRHFGALTGMGMIFQKIDNRKAALAAYARALEIHPHIERLKQTVERLKMDAEDRKI